jgi:integrase
VTFQDKSYVDISGYPALNNKVEVAREERVAIQRALDDFYNPPVQKKEVPTFDEWFNGRYMTDWCVVNKTGTVAEKVGAYNFRLKKVFGHLRLDEILTPEIDAFRAGLLSEKLGKKHINNLLVIISKPLRYAVDCGLISSAPKVGLLKHERPQIGAWELDEYGAIMGAALEEGIGWYVAVALCGEAGLRIGEVRELQWSDVDMKAKTITVARQRRHSVAGTPKGRTRRTIPMTTALYSVLRQLSTIRVGYVVRNDDGTPKTDGQDAKAIQRIYKRAGVPERFGAWHLLRHSFGAHAAMFGVNPWTLMKWMGHKRIEETMLYVEFAREHAREIPIEILALGARESDPDRRIIAMLGGRCSSVAVVSDGKGESTVISIG